MTTNRGLRKWSPALLGAIIAFATATCSEMKPLEPDVPAGPEVPGTPGGPPQALGVYEFRVTGIGTEQMQATARMVEDANGNAVDLPAGVQGALSAVSGLQFEAGTVASFTEGARNLDGQRYITLTYKVRNGSGAPVTNVTMVPGITASTIAGTPWSSLTKFDGSAAAASIAQGIAPTGAVGLGESGDVVPLYPDVLQVFTEAERAGMPLTGGITEYFPYGFVVRNRITPTSRTIPVAADANDFGGVLTFSFRFPLQATSTADPFSFVFWAAAISDTETRMTESIEEAQDTAAVRKLRERATALGATTVTVLNGSTVLDPAVVDYPGQRQICSVRTAGTAASPTQYINRPGAFSKVMMLWPGESVDACGAYFRSGTPGRPSLGNTFAIALRAMDRYGNVKTGVSESVKIVEVSGPPATIGAPVTMSAGTATLNTTYTDYGTALLAASTNRIRGTRSIAIGGVTRTWTAGAGTTNWSTNNNWSPAYVPGTLDSVYIPVAAPLDPTLIANVQVEGVTVEDVATLNLGAFNLTATGNVTAGLTGGITNTSGQLILAGTARTVQGRLPRIRVTGTYTLTGNVTARAPIQVDAGRITDGTYRLQAESN